MVTTCTFEKELRRLVQIVNKMVQIVSSKCIQRLLRGVFSLFFSIVGGFT